MPNSTLLTSLAFHNYPQPLEKAYVEEMGDDYGRHPIGVGPFRFKEWVTGEKIVLERNPDFNWGPAYAHAGPAYIETVEFRIIPEYATQLAGLEAGEIDYMYLEGKDLQRIEETDQFQVFSFLEFGAGQTLILNTIKPPLDDVRVREALAMAVDREVLVAVSAGGHAQPNYGPLTPNTVGYWPGVEYIAYTHDLNRAKALLEEAGFTYNGDGMAERDGLPLTLDLKTYALGVKDAEILQEQLKAVGVEVVIEQGEVATMNEALAKGEFDLTLRGFGWPDYGAMFAMFHPSMIGLFNYGSINDPELTQDLEMAVVTTDQALLDQSLADAQRRIVEQAYTVPLYAVQNYFVMNSRVKDAAFWPFSARLLLFDAYIETTQ
jgi:peptide/nickel transport system substrate-binding protein